MDIQTRVFYHENGTRCYSERCITLSWHLEDEDEGDN